MKQKQVQQQKWFEKKLKLIKLFLEKTLFVSLYKQQ